MQFNSKKSLKKGSESWFCQALVCQCVFLWQKLWKRSTVLGKQTRNKWNTTHCTGAFLKHKLLLLLMWLAFFLSFALALVSRFTCCCYESFCFYSAAAFVKVQTFILAILLLIIPGNPHRVITLTHTNGVEFSPFHCVIACVVRLVYANKNHISSLVWHSSSFSAA